MKKLRKQIAQVPDPWWDKKHMVTHIPALPDGYEGECPHPGPSQWAWYAYDGTICVACCACGAVQQGSATPVEEQQ
jgi:hypothetical protein